MTRKFKESISSQNKTVPDLTRSFKNRRISDNCYPIKKLLNAENKENVGIYKQISKSVKLKDILAYRISFKKYVFFKAKIIIHMEFINTRK